MRMLVLDSAYSFEAIQERKLLEFVTGRDQGEFFTQVTTVNFFSGIQNRKPNAAAIDFGRAKTFHLTQKDVLLESSLGRYFTLRRLEKLNVLLSIFEILNRINQEHRRENYKLIRAEDGLVNGFIGLLISRYYKVPLVIGIWGNSDAIRENTKKPLMSIFLSIRIERRIEQFTTKRAKFLLVGNQDNSNFLLRLGVLPSKIRILPVVFNLNPIHHVSPSNRSKLLIQDLGLERFQTILCISRLEPLKLVDHVIRALPFVGSDISRIRLLIVGDGPDSEKLKELTRSMGVEGNVLFLGNKDQEWLSQIIATTDVFVSPLAGRALAEAALGGAAVVAYDIDWHSELVEDKVSGVLVPYLDYETLGKSIGILLEDSNYRQELGHSIREKMQQKLESFNNISNLNDLYTKSLSNID